MKETRRWRGILASLVLAAVPAAGGDAPAGVSSREAFERIKSLAGLWEGSHTAKDGPAASVRYELTANGTAVMERLFPGTSHEMLSVYHLDGDQLVITHYCALGNQPRMRLEKATVKPAELSFGFAGGTNLDPAKDTHIHSGKVQIVDQDRLEEEWSVYEGGKQTGTNRLFLSRKK